MKHHRAPILSALLLAFASVLHAAELPPAAKSTLQSYEREVAAAKAKAVRQLQSVLETETKRGNLDNALAVKDAIEELGGGADQPGSGTKASGKVVIKATAPEGLVIGSYQKGDRISLQYVEGRWAMSGDTAGDPLKWANPDQMKEGPLSLGIFAIDDGGKRTLLAAVPSGTAKKQFRYRFESDCPKVCLRMMDNQASDNAGHVVYEIK